MLCFKCEEMDYTRCDFCNRLYVCHGNFCNPCFNCDGLTHVIIVIGLYLVQVKILLNNVYSVLGSNWVIVFTTLRNPKLGRNPDNFIHI